MNRDQTSISSAADRPHQLQKKTRHVIIDVPRFFYGQVRIMVKSCSCVRWQMIAYDRMMIIIFYINYTKSRSVTNCGTRKGAAHWFVLDVEKTIHERDFFVHNNCRLLLIYHRNEKNIILWWICAMINKFNEILFLIKSSAEIGLVHILSILRREKSSINFLYMHGIIKNAKEFKKSICIFA